MKTIAIFAGGNSSEREISLSTAGQIFNFIDKKLFNAYIIDVKGFEWNLVEGSNRYPVDKNTFSCTVGSKEIRFDFVWNAIHGKPGENGQVQGYFDMLQIPYSSCSLLTSALTFNKFMCKTYLQKYGIPMAQSVMVTAETAVDIDEIVGKLGLPLFVKPNTSGSSFGVSKVKKKEDLIDALNIAFAEDPEVVIESFIQGTEVSCGVFKSQKNTYLLPITEIVSANEYFDYEAKYHSKLTQEIMPARIPDEVAKKVHKYTSAIYDALYCKGIVRVDYIINGDTPYFLELNSIPGMSTESIVPKQIRTAGYNITDILTEVIEDALAKHMP